MQIGAVRFIVCSGGGGVKNNEIPTGKSKVNALAAAFIRALLEDGKISRLAAEKAEEEIRNDL